MEAINVGVLTFVIVAVIAVGILIYTYSGRKEVDGRTLRDCSGGIS